jgi:hypothetical protein
MDSEVREVAGFLSFVLSNFFLTFLVLGLIAAAISLWHRPHPLTKSLVVEDLFAYFLLFAIGFSFFYNFVFHVFLGDMAAEFIGWKQSPFQAEVGFASLGFSVVAFIAFRGALRVRAAAVAGVSCFMLGAAGGHVYQMIVAKNFAPGNAGVTFWTDIGIPIIGFALLWLEHRLGSESAPPEEIRGEAAKTS